MKYFLISYAHKKGFGNMFFECTTENLNIRDAELEIQQKLHFKEHPVIITINKISKKQWEMSDN